MPWFLKNEYIKLRKSEKRDSTDILFKIGEKQLKKLNFHSAQQFYNLDLIDYSILNKMKIIKLITKINKTSVAEIRKLMDSLPAKIIQHIPHKDVKLIELKLLELGCLVRIY